MHIRMVVLKKIFQEEQDDNNKILLTKYINDTQIKIWNMHLRELYITMKCKIVYNNDELFQFVECCLESNIIKEYTQERGFIGF